METSPIPSTGLGHVGLPAEPTGHAAVGKRDRAALTVPGGGQAQVLHAVFDQLRQLLPLRAPVQAEALLADPLGRLAGVLVALPAQPARPLHALAPQQRVLGLVAGARVPVVARLDAPVLLHVLRVLAVLNIDGDL